MPPREWKLRIEDILESIGKIERYTAGMSFVDFLADERTVDAVVRNFTIIGEAARHIPGEIVNRYPGVAWPAMRGLRNVVVHEYSSVDLETI